MFSKVDEELTMAVRDIANLITASDLTNADMSDVTERLLSLENCIAVYGQFISRHHSLSKTLHVG
jgi:hypothetical protein